MCNLSFLQRLPNQLPDIGGRIFVETKDGVLPLLGVTPLTPVAAIKHALEGLTGIPAAQQLLSSVGRVMHDEFLVNDYDGLHMVYEDSILDLSKSGKYYPLLLYFVWLSSLCWVIFRAWLARIWWWEICRCRGQKPKFICWMFILFLKQRIQMLSKLIGAWLCLWIWWVKKSSLLWSKAGIPSCHCSSWLNPALA